MVEAVQRYSNSEVKILCRLEPIVTLSSRFVSISLGFNKPTDFMPTGFAFPPEKQIIFASLVKSPLG